MGLAPPYVLGMAHFAVPRLPKPPAHDFLKSLLTLYLISPSPSGTSAEDNAIGYASAHRRGNIGFVFMVRQGAPYNPQQRV